MFKTVNEILKVACNVSVFLGCTSAKISCNVKSPCWICKTVGSWRHPLSPVFLCFQNPRWRLYAASFSVLFPFFKFKKGKKSWERGWAILSVRSPPKYALQVVRGCPKRIKRDHSNQNYCPVSSNSLLYCLFWAPAWQ